MTPPKDTLWPLPPHTTGKHEVLRHYLAAWFPIIGSFAPRLAFIDGFAGPGHYAGGEPGSPLIALDAFRTYAAKVKGKALFLFVEQDEQRAEHLRQTIASQKLPPNCEVEVTTGDFEPQMTAILDSIPGQQIAPAFLMLDPFGVSGMPMSLVRRLLESRKTELYITFMYEFVDRFKATPEFEQPLTELYGTEKWKKGIALEGIDKREFFFGLYRDQLRHSGAKHVLRFDLYEGGRLVYAIFFATKHWKGADVMKRAIWSVAPFGDFSFRSAHHGQLVLGLDTADYSSLREALQKEFRGNGLIAIDRIEEFVAAETDFHIAQLRKHGLVPLETSGALHVESSRKKARSYPPGTKIRFL
jgi:three-Cys-motif partner protein